MSTTSSWGQLTGVIRWWPILLQAMLHEMVEESVLPPVFLKHPECLHPLKAKNPVTCTAEDLAKGACEGAC